MKKILCIYNPELYDRYKKGIYPSHHIYGIAEIEQAGYPVKVIKVKKPWMNLWHVLKEKPSCIYIPFLRRREFKYIFFFKIFRIINVPIIGINHLTQFHETKLSTFYTTMLFKAVDVNFFLSPLNMEESIDLGLMEKEKCKILNWGPDLNFYNKFCNLEGSDGFYISTGKEYRDYFTLLEAFKKIPNETLKIYTCEKHLDYNYSNMRDCIYTNNIDVNIINNDELSFFNLSLITAKSKAIVIPLLENKINYCVGLSSIADAFAFGKAILVTNNSYHPIDVEEEGCGKKIKAGDCISWKETITGLSSEEIISMGKRSKMIGEKRYNMQICGKQIIHEINLIVKDIV